MASEFVNDKQKALFDEIAKAGKLVFACGGKGISANIVGEFCVRHYPEKKEHRLDMGDGEQHVHIDWARVKFVVHGTFQGEGMLIFKDGQETLFRLFRIAGDFSKETQKLVGALIQTSPDENQDNIPPLDS